MLNSARPTRSGITSDWIAPDPGSPAGMKRKKEKVYSESEDKY